MVYATVSSLTLSGSGTYAATPGFVTLPNTSWTGSATYLDGTETYTSTLITGGYLRTYFYAYNSGYDSVTAFVSSAFTTNWNLTGTFGVTLSQAVTVQIFEPSAATWLVNGLGLSDGQTLAAGTYTFGWTWAGNASLAFIGLGFHQSAGGAVPLPGAAGLAACGLLGLSRRRRR